MSDSKISVSFACQRCLQPLKLDDSFNSLGEHAIAELARKFLPFFFYFIFAYIDFNIFSSNKFK